MEKKVTYSLICVFVFFVYAKKRKNEKCLQCNVLNTNILVNMITKVIGPHKGINVLTHIKTFIPL